MRVNFLDTDTECLDQPVDDGPGGLLQGVGVHQQGLVLGLLLLGVLPRPRPRDAVLVPAKLVVLELLDAELLGGVLHALQVHLHVQELVPD